MANQCAMIVGYLVPHRCPNKALAECVKCGRSFCDEHVSIVQSGIVCLACQQGVEQPVLVPEVTRDYSAEDLAMFSTLGTYDTGEDLFADLS